VTAERVTIALIATPVSDEEIKNFLIEKAIDLFD
jgi:hypothetical protein